MSVLYCFCFTDGGNAPEWHQKQMQACLTKRQCFLKQSCFHKLGPLMFSISPRPHGGNALALRRKRGTPTFWNFIELYWTSPHHQTQEFPWSQACKVIDSYFVSYFSTLFYLWPEPRKIIQTQWTASLFLRNKCITCWRIHLDLLLSKNGGTCALRCLQ